jgi:hypothetical protein
MKYSYLETRSRLVNKSFIIDPFYRFSSYVYIVAIVSKFFGVKLDLILLTSCPDYWAKYLL